MALNFNVSPFYDDFDPNKNFHRILFKPGFAVQARELTQSQTILQNQISKFADHIFQKNSPVSGAKITYNNNANYIKLEPTFNDSPIELSDFEGQLIQNTDGDVIARVIAVEQATGTEVSDDPNTLAISYVSGTRFNDGDDIFLVFNPNIGAKAIASGATGNCSVASINEGVFYVVNGFNISEVTGTRYSIGHFVNVQPQTIILSKYTTNPTLRVGLNIFETITDYIDDVSLLDQADGAPNYQGPGADRYTIVLELETRTLTLGDDQNFIELLRIEDGQIKKQVDGSVYSTIDDYFAKRTFDTNGDYIVRDFKLTPSANTVDSSKYDLKVGKGVAYVRGYRIENQSELTLTNDRARTTDSIQNNPTFIEYGNYLYVDNANGVFDVTTFPSVDLHVVDKANIVTTNTTTYISTVAATAKIRGLEFDYFTNVSDTSTYVYKAYLTDIQNKTLTGTAVTGGSSTITLPATAQFSTTANAYYGVTISIDSGTGAGDVKRIVSYSSARVATVDSPWTVTPDNTSNFSLRFDVKDVESVIHTSSGTTIASWASINEASGKDTGSGTGDTILHGRVPGELIYNLPYQYAAGITDTSYQTTQIFRGIALNGSGISPTINFPDVTDMAFLSSSKENYIVIDESNGEILSDSILTFTLSNSNRSLVVTASGKPSATITVIAKVFTSNATNTSHYLKIKNLVSGNTTGVNLTGTTVNTNTKVDLNNGQVYVLNGGLVTPGQPQPLYISDVKRIVKIVDSLAPGTPVSNSMLNNATNDVTFNFSLDNGQRDSYYGHATITLLPGRPKPKGNLLVILDYYDHTGGDGYFSVASYTTESTSPENYGQIGTYIAKSGISYNLRDCLDFRPSVLNAQADFVLNVSGDTNTNGGVYIPNENSIFTKDYEFYLARYDRLILSKDKNFEIIKGVPSSTPILPVQTEGSLLIANLKHDPYTNYVPGEAPRGKLPNLSVERVQHRRWTMKDISDLQTRVNNLEYYTALNLLEKNAQSLQIPDANGLNRFKNGILVDDFSSFATADTLNDDFNASINRREKHLSAAQTVDNFPLQSSFLVSTAKKLSPSVGASTGFRINTVGETSVFTLNYSTANLASQTLASNTVNINKFATPIFEGVLNMTPPMDNWVDNTRQPDLLIIDPDLQLYQESDRLNTLSVGDWKTISGTEQVTSATTRTVNGRTVTETTTQQTTTTLQQSQSNILGYYDKLSSSYRIENGFITDISVLPFIRAQQVLIRAKGLKINTPISAWFDGVSVDNYMSGTDVIELTNVSGRFNEDDVIGFISDNQFYPIATVVSVYRYPGTSNVRLNIVGNFHTSYSDISPNVSKLQNATFNQNGSYSGTTANGTIRDSNIVSVHRTGRVSSVGGTFTDADANTVSLQRATNPNYSNMMNKYGVWFRQNVNSGTISFDVDFPTTGNYTINFGVDNNGTIALDGNTLITLTGSTASNYRTVHTVTTSVTSGVHKITINANNVTGPRSFFAMIEDSSKNVIFDTVSYIPLPTQVGAEFSMEGGGKYYTGVTRVTLNNVASATTDFYNGYAIKVTSTFVGRNSTTGRTSVTTNTYSATITSYDATTRTATLSTPINVSVGYNTLVAADVSSEYTINGTFTSYKLAVTRGGMSNLSSDESGTFVGVFNIPANVFKTGERIFRVDNRLNANDPDSATTMAQSTFTASGLSTKSQAIEFAPSIDSASKSFTQTNYQTTQLVQTNVLQRTYRYDPVAQTFIIDGNNFPNGAFISSIKLFFRTKPTLDNTPVTLSVMGTQNGYPNGETLTYGIVTKFPDEINVSANPHRLDPNSYTEFTFAAPVYIKPDTLYAFMLQTQSTDYNVWIAAQNSQAISSTVKNLPTDPTPSTITKIGTVPYVGSLFESQNAMTWTAEQGKALMFVMERCVFDTSKTPKLPFIIPQSLPNRKLTGQTIAGYYDANTISNVYGNTTGLDVESHAYNITTTDFVPSLTNLTYSYRSTLDSTRALTSEMSVTPGKYGCATNEDIYLNDGRGERVLVANSNTSFFAFATLQSQDNRVSPIISDDALTLYNIRWDINDMELTNTSITIVDGGTGYNVETTTVTVSTPNESTGTQAIATANISGGVIESIDFINPGSGYTTTPTITVSDDTTRSGNSNTSFIVHGETSSSGGNGIAKYFTKQVILTPGNDSGDLRVYYTAYRPFGTNIYVYYKILNRNDTQTFEEGNWQLMTPISNISNYSQNRDDLYEFQVAPGTGNVADNFVSYTSATGETYTSFSQFAIKVVMSTNDKTTVPFLTSLTAIALPSGVGF
jgi:hypothetical protein